MAIEIRNKKGDLADIGEAVLNIEKYSSLFTDNDKIFQDITLPLSLPFSPSNIVFFGGGHLVEAANDIYEIDVQVSFGGTPFFTGIVEYTIDKGAYDVLLLVNFGQIRNTVKNTLISDIYVKEDFPEFTEALMYDTCLHPERYNYAFFPVYNTYYAGDGHQYPFTNFWNHGLQKFVIDYLDEGGGGDAEKRRTRQCTFYKLNYIIKKVCKSLGFEAEGSHFDDKETDYIYIYTDINIWFGRVMASHLGLPRNVTLETFFKILKTRFRITISFNMLTGTATVNNAKELISSSEVIDISDFVAEIPKFSPPEKQGYTVYLKPDPTDELFKNPIDAENYIPTNKMVVGDGEKTVEILASTLKVKDSGSGYSYPEARHPIYRELSPNASNTFRFLYFKGFKNVGSGKVFPEALPLELGEDDANWYKLLNDSKIINLKSTLPLDVLYKLDLTKKLKFQTFEGAHITALNEFCKYDIDSEDLELIPAEHQCWSVNYQTSTEVRFLPYIEESTGSYERTFKFKAYFPNNLSPVKIDLVYPAGTKYYRPPNSTELTLESDYKQTGYLIYPTNAFRGDGTKLLLERLVPAGTVYINEPRLRVFQKPQYAVTGYSTIYFTHNVAGGYWECQFGDLNDIEYTVWIVF